jgi:acyl-CoA-binding protein
MKFSEFYENYINGHFLVERIDDENFRNQVNDIVDDILKEFKNSGKKDVYLVKYSLLVGITNNKNRINVPGYFTVLDRNKYPMINLNAISRGLGAEFENKEYYKIVEKMKDDLFHEVVHFLNYMGWKDNYHPRSVTSSEYNNDREFNAYYQEVANSIEKELKSGKVFEEVCGTNAQDLIKIILFKLYDSNVEMVRELINDAKYKWKWFKRISQLYYELKKKYNKELDKELNEEYTILVKKYWDME